MFKIFNKNRENIFEKQILLSLYLKIYSNAFAALHQKTHICMTDALRFMRYFI